MIQLNRHACPPVFTVRARFEAEEVFAFAVRSRRTERDDSDLFVKTSGYLVAFAGGDHPNVQPTFPVGERLERKVNIIGYVDRMRIVYENTFFRSEPQRIFPG